MISNTLKTRKRVDSFLFCCKLETGGLFFGWFGIIGCILSLLMFILIIVGLSQDFITDDVLRDMGYGDPTDKDQLKVVRHGEYSDLLFAEFRIF